MATGYSTDAAGPIAQQLADMATQVAAAGSVVGETNAWYGSRALADAADDLATAQRTGDADDQLTAARRLLAQRAESMRGLSRIHRNGEPRIVAAERFTADLLDAARAELAGIRTAPTTQP
jgi:hypothetical protein